MGLLDQSTITQPTFTPVSANETVQGQLNNVLDSNNPLMERAKTRALQSANKRGLLNSSLGVQAGEEAVLTAALPIAQQDAQTYKDRTQLKDDWQNKFGLEGNAFQYQTALSDQGHSNTMAQIGAQGGVDLSKIQEQGTQNRLNIGEQSGADLAKIQEQGTQSRLNIGSQSTADLSKIQEQGAQERLTGTQQYQQQVGSGNFAEGLIRAQLASEQALQEQRLTHEAQQNQLQREMQASEGLLQREHEGLLQSQQLTQQSQNLATELAMKWDLSEADISTRLALATQQVEADAARQGVQITHEAAMQEASNLLDRDLQTERLALQQGISQQEMQNRLDLQANEITATEVQYLAEIASREDITASELANRLAINTAEIASRELLAGNQIDHEAALSEAKNSLERELTVERLASQEGISEAELQNRLTIQANQLQVDESRYLAEIASRENISTAELANRLELNAAEIASRELLAGNQITHEAALAEAKNQLENDLQVARIASQEGISEAELQNRIDVQAAQITANEAQYLAEIASREQITTDELANRLALSEAEITSRELLAGNQITHETALAEAKNQLENDLQVARIASQEGISTAELQNRIDLQAAQITADEAQYLAEITSREGITADELANRLALSEAEITSRELLAGNQITHEAALAEAKNQLENDLQVARIASQEGISEAELQNRIDVQAAQISADEAQYLAEIASREQITTDELANRLALSEAEITSRELLAGNQITHETALAEAKNQLENDLQVARIASQEGISTAELQNRIDVQAAQITANEAQYLAEITSREGITADELANRLALSEAEITSRETLAGNQITHEAALAEAKNQLERDLQTARSEATIAQIQEGGVQDRAMETLRFAQDVGVEIEGFGGQDVYLDPATGEVFSAQNISNLTSVAALDILKLYLDKDNSSGIFEQEVDGRMLGDINGDGEIDLGDSLAAIKNGVGKDLPEDQLAWIREKIIPAIFNDPDAASFMSLEKGYIKVGESGRVSRMGMQLANDLAKMDADTENRISLTAAEYAAKGKLSTQEHDQFLTQVTTEYGLQNDNRETIEAAANYRAELSAESTRLATQAGLDQSAMKLMTSLEETQMEQWVEINKMVFDPDDPDADATYRQEAIDALNLEYADRKELISTTVSELSNWDWTVSTVEGERDNISYGGGLLSGRDQLFSKGV